MEGSLTSHLEHLLFYEVIVSLMVTALLNQLIPITGSSLYLIYSKTNVLLLNKLL